MDRKDNREEAERTAPAPKPAEKGAAVPANKPALNGDAGGEAKEVGPAAVNAEPNRQPEPRKPEPADHPKRTEHKRHGGPKPDHEAKKPSDKPEPRPERKDGEKTGGEEHPKKHGPHDRPDHKPAREAPGEPVAAAKTGELEKQLASANDKNKDLEKQLSVAKADSAKQHDKQKAAEALSSSLKEKGNDLHKQLVTAKEKIKELEKKHAADKSEHAKDAHKRKTADDLVTALKAKVKDLEKQLEPAKEKIKELEKHLASAKADHAKANEKLGRIQESLIKAERKLEQSASDYAKKVVEKGAEAQRVIDEKIKEFQKQFAATTSEAKRYAISAGAEALAEVANSFRLVMQGSSAADEKVKAYAKGFSMVHDQLVRALGELGMRPMAVKVGDAFDPTTMEVIEEVAVPGARRHAVVEVVKQGYHLHERVVAHALVKVAK